MTKKIKQTVSERVLLIFIIFLAIIFFGSLITMKNKCLFVKNYDPKKINFINPNDIAILNAYCGNVIIELYPNISPNSVERFKMLIKSGEYNNVAFHRV
ncbi:MAG: peptidylprolyl isomerase, partial [Candidatus Pelagibacter sp.]|nr:peptidylprolyl isomerase [Candidatus Pelagibacter sp.]